MMALLKNKTFWKLAAIALGALGLLIGSRFAPVEAWTEDLIARVEQSGAAGMLIFSAVYVAAMVACVWGTPFTVAAGMAFGIWWGTTIAVFSVTAGSAIAFLIGRYLARSLIEKWAESNERFKAIDAAIGKHGWKIVFLIRFIPIIPFSVSNYLLGLTQIGLWPFVWASTGAVAPGSFVVAYLGHVGRLAVLDEWENWGGWQYALIAAALIFATGAVFYFTRAARRALAELSAKETW